MMRPCCLIRPLLALLAVAAAGCASEPRQGAARERALGSAEKGTSISRAGAAPAPAPAAAARPGADPTRRAIVIGVSRYADAAIPPLPFARTDAEAIYSFLIDDAGCGYPRAGVQLLLDGEATRERIQEAVLRANAETKPSDTLLIYFAGHGAVDLSPGGDLLGNYLLPVDARAVKRGADMALDPPSGLGIAKLQQLLQVNRARNLFLVLDACFSGGAGGRSFSRVALDARQAARSEAEIEGLKDAGSGRAVLAATAPNQPALESAAWGGGLFTRAFLEALNADQNRDGSVTLQETYDHLYTRVRDEAARLGREQTPTIKENRTGISELRVLPRTRFRVGMKVRYGPGAAVEGRADAPARPVTVADARAFSVAVDAWDARVPLRAYVLRVALGAAGARGARLLPDGENALAPEAVVADGAPAVWPILDEEGAAEAEIAAAERDAHVLFILLVSEAALDLRLLDRVERRLVEEAGRGERDDLARRAAVVIEGEPALKHVALRYAYVRHGRGAAGAGR